MTQQKVPERYYDLCYDLKIPHVHNSLSHLHSTIKSTMIARALILCSFICSAFASNSTIVSYTGAIREGAFRYHYDESVPNACDTVLFIGVGTAMSVNDYDQISSLIVTGKPIVTIISDHDPRWFVKLSSKKFASFYNEMTGSLQSLVPACKGKDPMILVGAHSASGQASIEALPNLKRKPDGYVGLDPFKINERKMKIDKSIPTLEWGFAKTTCAVKIGQAAKPAYKISSKNHRVFYRVDNISEAIAHCVFTDKGCGFVCGMKSQGSWVRDAVAKSIHAFVSAIESGDFQKEAFALPIENGSFELFVNDEDPDAKSEL